MLLLEGYPFQKSMSQLTTAQIWCINEVARLKLEAQQAELAEYDVSMDYPQRKNVPSSSMKRFTPDEFLEFCKPVIGDIKAKAEHTTQEEINEAKRIMAEFRKTANSRTLEYN